MKVNIGPHVYPLTTHVTKCNYLELMYGEDWYDITKENYIWLDHFVVSVLDAVDYCILRPINKFRKRKVKVQYHKYDTWGLEHTLALVILPGLKQLKATNHGMGIVDNDDLPTKCLKDASSEERWEWVMDEMIWAFNEITTDGEGEKAFYSGVSDWAWSDLDEGYSTLNYGPNHTFKIDIEGLNKYNERIQRGTILFGKYYRSLWD